MAIKNLRRFSLLALLACLALSGCQPKSSETPPLPPPAPPAGAPLRQSTGAQTSKSAPEPMVEIKASRQKQVKFLNELRGEKTQFGFIKTARFNAQGEPMIILKGNQSWKEVQPLLKNILTRMLHEFPGEDLMVTAYAPAKTSNLVIAAIGVAKLDADTLEITYTPAAK